MDRISFGTLLTLVLFYFGFKYYLDQNYPDRHKRPEQTEVEARHSSDAQNARSISNQGSNPTPELNASSKEKTPQLQAITALSSDELTIENDEIRYIFNQDVAGLESVTLKKFQNDEQTAALEIVRNPFIIRGASSITPIGEHGRFEASRADRTISFSHYDGAWQITTQYTIDPQGYGANVELTWKNIGQNPASLNSSVVMQENILFPEKSGSFLPGIPTGKPSFVTGIAGSSGDWQDIEKYCEDGENSLGKELQELDFIGFDKHYFLKVLVPSSKKLSYKLFSSNVLKGHSCTLSNWMNLQQGNISPGDSISMSFKTWFGPKVADLLEAYDPRLSETQDLGMFSVISKPLFLVMKSIESALGNWGLAIIVLTLLIKLIFYPLTKQAAVAQNRMKKLQPEMNKIKEKFKDDQRRQQQEIMRFMGTHKVNPAKGCLPILPQIPVFIAFYRLLSTSIELRQAPFYGWISDLSVADPYFITPIFLGLTMLVQQKLMPTTGLDKTQERIMMMLPLVFSIMMLTLPAGMVLYMLTNTVVSIAQQQWLNRRLKTE
ncbi:MAG: membrane protein insertase YidC [Oligoflexales bacterium]